MLRWEGTEAEIDARHVDGWDHHLARLGVVAAGGEVDPDVPREGDS